jgi:hypothetical protein
LIVVIFFLSGITRTRTEVRWDVRVHILRYSFSPTQPRAPLCACDSDDPDATKNFQKLGTAYQRLQQKLAGGYYEEDSDDDEEWGSDDNVGYDDDE